MDVAAEIAAFNKHYAGYYDPEHHNEIRQYLRKHLPSRSGSKHALMETLAAWENS